MCYNNPKNSRGINMNYIVYKEKEALLIDQVAELLNSNAKALMRNFQRNKDKFIEGIHFIYLDGAALREFKKSCTHDLTFVSKLYLWTDEGVKLLAKSTGNDVAWEYLKGE